LLSVADKNDPREFCRMVNLILTIESGDSVVKMVGTQGISGIVQSYDVALPEALLAECVEHAMAAKEFVRNGGEYVVSLDEAQVKRLLAFCKSDGSKMAYIFAPTDRELNDLKTESVDIKLDTRTGDTLDYKLDVKRAIFK